MPSLVDDVTILIYTFPKPGTEDAAFAKIAASIERTWTHVGRLKTVIVASHRFAAVEKFVEDNKEVELQIEPTIVPGNIKTMSMDCIKRLYRRFSTPYVLIIQDDGFPIRGGLEEFLGKCDFYGAPIISDGWKRKLAYAIGLGSFNGGFSLRSRRLCEYASKMWFAFFSKFMAEDNRHLGEDFYYTTLLKFLPMTWFRFRFPSEREAFRFSVDTLGGRVSYPKLAFPFGLHGKDTMRDYCSPDPLADAVTILTYTFPKPEAEDAAFAKIVASLERTWEHVGRLKTVIVASHRFAALEQFVADNREVELQIEPTLRHGDIHTMSVDCNSKLYTRFSTPYVLIVQDDGYPLRKGLEKFVGKYDFIGAPYVRDVWWKNLICRVFNCWVQNGGFSLRSRCICEAAARYWNEKYYTLGKCQNASEDLFYTKFLPLHERAYRKAFRLATNRESLRFSWDGAMPIPRPKELPFGFHGKIKWE